MPLASTSGRLIAEVSRMPVEVSWRWAETGRTGQGPLGRERLDILAQLLELLLGGAVALGRSSDKVDELLAGLLLRVRE